MNDITSASSNSAPAKRPDAATYMGLFTDDQTRCAPGALMANNSRLAYLVHLKELILAFEVRAKASEPITLLKRRPDLLALTLDDKTTRKILPKVRLVLGLLESRAQEALTAKQSLQPTVAKGVYNANVPFHYAWESIKATLAAKNLLLLDVLNSPDAGYPAFIFDNLALATLRSATLLSNGCAPQLQALLLSQKSQDNLTLVSIDTTQKLTKALGLTRRELRKLLAVDAVGEGNTTVKGSAYVASAAAASSAVHGATFINNAGTPLYLSESQSAQPSAKKTVAITGLTDAHLDRMLRILRVQRALGLSAAECDGLVMAALRAEGQQADYHLTGNTLRALGQFRHLQQKYQVTPWQYAALIDAISPYATDRQASFYDQLFAPANNDEIKPAAPILSLDDSEFDPLATSGDDGLTVKQLCLALNLDDALLRVILGWVTTAQGLAKPTRSLAVVSACYRIVALARVFGTSTQQGLCLLELLMDEQPIYRQQLAGKPSLLGETGQADIVDVITGVTQAMEWVQQQGMDTQRLARLLSQQVPYLSSAWENAFRTDTTQSLDALHEALRNALGLEAKDLVEPLLRWAKIDPQALTDRIKAIAQQCPKGSTALSCFTASDYLQWSTLQRHSDVMKLFNLSAKMLMQVSLNPGWFALKGKKKNTWRPLDLTTVYQFSRYKALLAGLAPGQGEPDVLKYLAEFDTETGGPLEGTRGNNAWSALERLLGQPSGALTALAGTAPPSTLQELDRLLRLLEQAKKHHLAVDTLLELGTLPKAKDYAPFEQAAIALRKGCSNKQRKALDAQLSIAWRDALMQWMIVHWAPKDVARDWVISPQTLADYLLIDLQVSHEPLTTRTLSATASLQRYLHQIHSHLENGYRNTEITRDEHDEWENFSSSYERWKLRKDAQNEPQNFIDPTRRQRKTTAFKDLETALSQGKCTEDEVNIAMLDYLSSFEKVSNIQPISVYANGTSPLKDIYHFIGKTNVEPTEYYWRTLDMSKRDKKDATSAPSMLAWSEWEKITFTVNGQMAVTPLPKASKYVKGKGSDEEEKANERAFDATQERITEDQRGYIDLVRPVVIAGRRYAVWVERDNSAIPMGDDSKASDYYALRVCFSYQQTDGMWTPTNELLCLDGHDDKGKFEFKLSENKYLKTKEFKPGLMVMVNIEGDRLDDPWLTVLLFNASSRAIKDDNYFIVMKDLLLLESKSLDIDNEKKPIQENLAKNWFDLFNDPRTVQHPYKGPLIELQPKDNTKKQLSWLTASKQDTLTEKYGIPSLGTIDIKAPLSNDQKHINISAEMQDTWLPATLFISEPFTVIRYDHEDQLKNKGEKIATITIELHEIAGNTKQYKLITKATFLSKSCYKSNEIRLYISKLPTDTRDTRDTLFTARYTTLTVFSLESTLAQQELHETIDKEIAQKLHTINYLKYSIHNPATNHSVLSSAELITKSYKQTAFSRLRSKLTISPSNAPHATWTLPKEDLQRLKTPALSQLNTLPSQNPTLFNSLKQALLKTRYTTLPEYYSQLGISENTNDQGRLAYGEAIARARKSTLSSAADAITAFISKEVEEIKQADSALPENLLKAALRLRHYHPESCLRILLYLDPTHIMVFEDVLLKNDQSQALCQYPINRDITELTLKLEVFDEAFDDESLASVQEVYTLVSKRDDSVPSVFIRRNDQQALYLDLSEANEKAVTEHKLSVQSLRLNTLFGKQLVALATQSFEQALSWKAQHLTEPRLEPGSSATTVDFRSANGLYFWELFFHVPFLIAWLQRQNREYRLAWHSCTRHLFDPYRTWVPDDDNPPRHWLTEPLLDLNTYATADKLNDPYLLAYAEPERYRKALHLFVVENWQRQGDDQYRMLNPDSLVEAALCYDKALRLIGVLPENLSSAPTQAPSLADACTDAFTPPLNNKLVELRNLLRNRLFNLRHGLTLDGKPASIMLDPNVIGLLALGHGNAEQDQSSTVTVARVVPPCRYEEVRKCAGEAVLQLIELGQTQLRLYESEAAQKLALASKKHIIKLLEFPCRLQEQALELAKRERDTVMASQQMVLKKQAYYQGLVNEGITELETAAMALGGVAQGCYATSIPFQYKAGILDTIPKIFGMAFGNAQPNQGMARMAITFEALGKISELVGDDLRLRAGYQLRSQQWQFEADQASFELKVIDKQLREGDIRVRAASIAMEEARTRLAAHRTEHEIMTSVFTSYPTYLWLIGRMADIYSSAYDATLSLCLMAESCLQYELGDFSTTWIRTDSWLDNWRGMLAGEALERDLMEMDLAAIRENHRPLDIHAELSLVKDLGFSKETLQKALEKDEILFELAPHHFDKHFPGHYMRRIEHIFLTFTYRKGTVPTSPSGMLYQTANRVLLKDDSDGANYLYGVEGGNPKNVLLNLNPGQKIAIWATKKEFISYDLQPSIPDKSRYQPFEGTGLLSSWRLEFPRGAKNNSSLLEGDTCKLEDIKVHVIYSALDGSADFRKAVKTLLQQTGVNVADIPASTKNPSGTTENPSETTGNAHNAIVSAKKAEQVAIAAMLAAEAAAAAPALTASVAAGEKLKATQAVTAAQNAAKAATTAREKTEAASASGKVNEANTEATKAETARDEALKAAADAVAASLAAQGLEIQRRASALAEAMKADQEAAAWSQAAQDDANADALKATEAADQLATANTAATEAKTAASKAKTAREKADNATTADDAEKAAVEAKSAADEAKAAAKKAADARKEAEDAYRLKKDQEADLITKKIAYLEKNMNKEIRIPRWTGNGNAYYTRGTLISIDKKNNTFTLKSEVNNESYTLPITDVPLD
ncbi:hypothetical protein GIB19_11165 [Pseudomonas sp. ITEM 17296]|uniref:Tc toxin subunit A-related protein n=1 Tax=Pseudomonas sp. ITEM 17296 TaxID=2790281 RepID=UPI0023801486|nr:neuraminidase-like domain-containing protein [Pseudomonas sp. ITEM 17296]MDE4537774.1 hypothetical protein [Pseudomonas sp. ITEM 17296]